MKKVFSTKDLPKKVQKELELKYKIDHASEIDKIAGEIAKEMTEIKDDDGLYEMYKKAINKSKDWDKDIEPKKLLLRSRDEYFLIYQYRKMLELYVSAASKKALIDGNNTIKKRIKEGINFSKA